MARVPISEYRAKKLLIGDSYQGFQIQVDALKANSYQLSASVKYVVKVDQGVKKRAKRGLLELNVDGRDVPAAVKRIAERSCALYPSMVSGTGFLVEPMIDHDPKNERYLSIERNRDGFKVLFSTHGGIEIEENPGDVELSTINYQLTSWTAWPTILVLLRCFFDMSPTP